MPGRIVRTGRAALAAGLLLMEPQWAYQSAGSPGEKAARVESARPVETLHYGIEWRLVRAGTATLARTPRSDAGWESTLVLESAGLVSKLYRVKDEYRVLYDSAFCASATTMHAEEGSRRRDTTVHFDRDEKKSHYLEKDLVKGNVVLERTLEIPSCVHDVVTALTRLRAMKLKPGQTVQLPVTDGKKAISARVDAQEKETVKTPAGTYQTVRYEAYLFNDLLYKRQGRLFVWLTDDEKQLPVQIRARLSFPVGTISFQLEKVGN
ncbi:MAG: DUF3108 domain-containing protein [Bryobacteraceae bacterium]|nr:DUF3108 domain-containing protein [Bryobacteraceae bacterium]